MKVVRKQLGILGGNLYSQIVARADTYLQENGIYLFRNSSQQTPNPISFHHEDGASGRICISWGSLEMIGSEEAIDNAKKALENVSKEIGLRDMS